MPPGHEGRVRQELSLPLIAELAAVYLLPDGQYDIRTGHAPGARSRPAQPGSSGSRQKVPAPARKNMDRRF
jgi:hypothetical protein